MNLRQVEVSIQFPGYDGPFVVEVPSLPPYDLERAKDRAFWTLISAYGRKIELDQYHGIKQSMTARLLPESGADNA